MAINPPTGCLLKGKPKGNSIFFAGRYINLRLITYAQGIDHSYLSRIFNGQRLVPRVEHGKKIAAALGMSFQDFLDALEERHQWLRDKALRTTIQHKARIQEEDNANIARVRSGRAPVPALPGTR